MAAGALGVGVFSYIHFKPATVPVANGPSSGATFSGSSVSLQGKIEAVQVVAVPVPIDGTIDRMPVDVGQEVYEGQFLANIRSSNLELDRDAAAAELSKLRTRVSTLESNAIEANMKALQARDAAGQVRDDLDAAQKDLQREQMLFKEGAHPKQALQKAQQTYDGLKARFDGLDQVARIVENRAAEVNKDLDKGHADLAERTKYAESSEAQVASGQVVSPVDGLVIARRFQAGQDVTIETEDLFQIATNLTALKVVLQPDPRALERIKVGQEALIHVAELSDAIVAQVSEVRDNQVFIEFSSPSPALKPGLTVQVLIKLT